MATTEELQACLPLPLQKVLLPRIEDSLSPAFAEAIQPPSLVQKKGWPGWRWSKDEESCIHTTYTCWAFSLIFLLCDAEKKLPP